MTSRREAGPPPEIPGYRFQRLLGTGGYSDVHLYRQDLPDREVAVKVLFDGALDEGSGPTFVREANVMAALSAHPFIVTVFQAAISADGRPYLVMEYYPGGSFAERLRLERLPVAEVLQVAVQLSGAVETAHRSGILHRDLKPANVLLSEYGRPGLTDFGIATGTGQSAEAEGLSIPWAPPEIASGSGHGDVRSDVYSLAATVYTMLANRSPYEEPGGSNRSLDLVARIERGQVPPTARADVPDSLERLLRQAMSKDPDLRPPSADAFGRAVQDVEQELRLAVTPLEVRGEYRRAVAPAGPEEDRTRLKAPRVIEAHRGPAPSASPPPFPPSGPATVPPPPANVPPLPSEDGTVRRATPFVVGAQPPSVPPFASSAAPAAAPAGSGATGAAPAPAPAAGAGQERPRRSDPAARRRLAVRAVAVALVVLVALVVVRFVVGSGSEGGGSAATTTTTPSGLLPSEFTPPGLADLTGTASADGVALAWTSPTDASLSVRVLDPAGATLATVGAASLGVTVPGVGDVCVVRVEVVRGDVTSEKQQAAGC